MSERFPGFPKEGLQFLRDLKANNQREWFQPRKIVFEEKVRLPMVQLATALSRHMARFAPDYVADPAKNIFRIYRDTRFSKDKTPYKTHTAALFWRNGFGKDDGAGFFFLVSPEGIEVAGGLYKPAPDALLAVRQHIAENTAEFRKTYSGANVRKLFRELSGASATRMPKGFEATHPAANLIRRKQFTLFTKLPAETVVDPGLLPQLVERFRAITPFVEFLNRPLLTLPRKATAKFYEE